MKLYLKLGIFVLVLFALVITTCLLWTPVKVRYYVGKLRSDHPAERVKGFKGLFSMGEKGIDKLVKEFNGGLRELGSAMRYWKYRKTLIPADSYVDDCVAQDISFQCQLAYYGYIETLKLCFYDNVDINMPDHCGAPIYSAARGGHINIVRFLIENGANVNAKSYDGKTPLHGAAENMNKDIALLLLEKGADINAKERNGWTPLNQAIRNYHKDAAALLIEKGADVNVKDVNGMTPLHNAVVYSNKDAAALLIEKDVDVNAIDDIGKTPLDRAVSGRQKETAALLRSHGGKTGEELREEAEK
jgi:hypothetical protein